MSLEARDAVGAQHKPDLERSKTATKGDLPVSIVGDEARFGEVVAEVGRGDG